MNVFPRLMLALSLALVASCATADGQKEERASELEGTRCFDVCGAGFTACSQDPNNDMASCTDQRNQCETECRAQKADEERQTDERVIPPEEMMEDIEPDDEGLSDEEIQDEVVDDPLEGEGVSKEENE